MFFSDGFPLVFLLIFLLLPIAFLAIFAWLVPAMLRRAGFQPVEEGMFSSMDGDGNPQDTEADLGETAGRDGRRRGGFFGPSPWVPLVIGLGVLALSFFLSPMFLPGIFLIFPFFWVGGWKKSFRAGRSPARRHKV